MNTTKIRVITYAESREEFFQKKLKKAERSLDNVVKYGTDPDACAEKGEIVSFYEDAITALRDVSRLTSALAAKDEMLKQAVEVSEMKQKPLTLDELKSMVDKPVYCVDSKGNGMWAFVDLENEVCVDSHYEDWEFYCYGWDNDDGWLAYKNKPKGAQHG